MEPLMLMQIGVQSLPDAVMRHQGELAVPWNQAKLQVKGHEGMLADELGEQGAKMAIKVDAKEAAETAVKEPSWQKRTSWR